MDIMETVDKVQNRNPIYLVRTNNYRSVVVGIRGTEIVARKYFLADTQLEARHKAAEYIEGWRSRHGKDESNQKR